MSKTIIITRPEHDPGTKYLSKWSQKIIDLAEKKGFNVIDLKEKKASKKDLTGRLKKLNPSLVILNGHGNSTSITGHDNEILIKAKENENLLKNKITYAISCDAAKKLGVACVDNKTAFIGYKGKFIFMIDQSYLTKPLSDKRAGKYLNASNQVPLSLIKGKTAEESSEKSKDYFKKAIKSLLTNGRNDPDAIEDAKNLWWNMTHQVCLGNQDARI
jgi:hypothetical protein